jgi:hypothetical protein
MFRRSCVSVEDGLNYSWLQPDGDAGGMAPQK